MLDDRTGLGALPAALLEGQAALVDRWLAAAADRCWQLRLDDAMRTQLRARAENALASLSIGVQASPDLALGDANFRESIQLFSFLAGWMAGVRLPISAAVALCHGLQDLFGGPEHVYQSLVVVVSEAYAVGIDESAQARHRAIMEKSQVVCALERGIVALFLVGDPDHEALDDAVGRLMMLAVMRDARGIVVDVSALLNESEVLVTAVLFLGQHRQAVGRREVVLSGIAPKRARELSESTGVTLSGYEQLEQALAALRSTD